MTEIEASEEDFEFEDETLVERLWGLTEMFPEPLRNVSSVLFDNSVSLGQNLFKWSKTGMWVVASSFTVLVLPIICEQERSTFEQQQQMQQRELLLGPSAASSPPTGMPGIPFGAAK